MLVQGISEVTYADESAARGFFRGGNWNGGGSARGFDVDYGH